MIQFERISRGDNREGFYRLISSLLKYFISIGFRGDVAGGRDETNEFS